MHDVVDTGKHLWEHDGLVGLIAGAITFFAVFAAGEQITALRACGNLDYTVTTLTVRGIVSRYIDCSGSSEQALMGSAFDMVLGMALIGALGIGAIAAAAWKSHKSSAQ